MLYAKTLKPDNVYILSAEYGLLQLTDIIKPYDKTLNTMGVNEIKTWAGKVLHQLNDHTDLQKDEFIFLAGVKYRKYLLNQLSNVTVPLDGLRIGEQLQWLTKMTNKSI